MLDYEVEKNGCPGYQMRSGLSRFCSLVPLVPLSSQFSSSPSPPISTYYFECSVGDDGFTVKFKFTIILSRLHWILSYILFHSSHHQTGSVLSGLPTTLYKPVTGGVIIKHHQWNLNVPCSLSIFNPQYKPCPTISRHKR